MWKYAYNLTRSPQPPLSVIAKKTMRNRWRAYAERKALAGLTTRGTVPKRRREERLALADLDVLAKEIAAEWHNLPPVIKAAMLRLELSLSAVRKKLI